VWVYDCMAFWEGWCRSGGGPSVLDVGNTMALYETVLLGAIFQFASDAVEMRNYMEAFLEE
jgi:hypothetical protein